jgi:hypothetical protein
MTGVGIGVETGLITVTVVVMSDLFGHSCFACADWGGVLEDPRVMISNR